MSHLAYLRNTDNKAAASGVVATAFSTASGYSVDNAITLPVAKVHRNTGVGSSEYIELDLGSAQAIKCAAVINHNLSSTATITIKGGAAANPSTFTQTITWREFDAFVLFAATQTYRYWRFTFTDNDNTYGFIQVGYLLLGAHTTISGYNFDKGWRRMREHGNRRLETSYFVPNIEQIARRIRLSLSFSALASAEITEVLTTLFDDLDGNVTPLFVIPDGAVNDGYFGRWVSVADETIIDGKPYVTLDFLEDGRGNLIAR